MPEPEVRSLSPARRRSSGNGQARAPSVRFDSLGLYRSIGMAHLRHATVERHMGMDAKPTISILGKHHGGPAGAWKRVAIGMIARARPRRDHGRHHAIGSPLQGRDRTQVHWVRSSGRSARAPSGRIAAALPRSAMNSRRLTIPSPKPDHNVLEKA